MSIAKRSFQQLFVVLLITFALCSPPLEAQKQSRSLFKPLKKQQLAHQKRVDDVDFIPSPCGGVQLLDDGSDAAPCPPDNFPPISFPPDCDGGLVPVWDDGIGDYSCPTNFCGDGGIPFWDDEAGMPTCPDTGGGGLDCGDGVFPIWDGESGTFTCPDTGGGGGGGGGDVDCGDGVFPTWDWISGTFTCPDEGDQGSSGGQGNGCEGGDNLVPLDASNVQVEGDVGSCPINYGSEPCTEEFCESKGDHEYDTGSPGGSKFDQLWDHFHDNGNGDNTYAKKLAESNPNDDLFTSEQMLDSSLIPT